MVTILGQQSTENTARLELRALERMIGALCEHTERLARVTRNEAASRETDLTTAGVFRAPHPGPEAARVPDR